MSDPTYRIDVEHHPHAAEPWGAVVTRLSDDRAMAYRTGFSAEEACDEAQAAIVEMGKTQPSITLYVDDDGRPVEGHSVKAS